MKTLKKMLVYAMALLSVLALSVGLVACGAKPEDSGKDSTDTNTTDVTVAGGYAIYFADQGGYGLELNLYENGTFYYSQYTSALHYGKYSSETATGTDSEGRKKLYTVTFTENDIFGTEAHYIVQDSSGDVLLTSVHDSMSNATRELKKQENFIEEVVQTVATYWSNDYATDFVKLELFSDDSYALDGINGAGQAGSMGTYTKTEKDGAVTYSLTDGTDKSKVYTLTVGAEIKLTGASKEYSMTDLDPEAKVSYTFSGKNDWQAEVTFVCYDNSTCIVNIAMGDAVNFTDAKGTWSYMEADDIFVFTFGSATLTAEASEEDANTYSVEYTIANENFATANKVTLSYSKPVVEGQKTWSFIYNPVMSYAAGEKVTMTCTAAGNATSYVFTGSLWGSMPVTLTCAADGTCSAKIDAQGSEVDEGSGTWSKSGDVITITIGSATYTANVQA